VDEEAYSYLAKCESTLSKVSEAGADVDRILALSNGRSLTILAALAYNKGTIPYDVLNTPAAGFKGNITTLGDLDLHMDKADLEAPGYLSKVPSKQNNLRDFSHFRTYSSY
jgi:hypothetical protein